MRIAITAHGGDRHAKIDPRFGRADYFVLYDKETNTWSALPNTQNIEAAHGAGIQAGQTIAQSGANILLTGHVGPKAFRVLVAANIATYSFGDMEGTAEEALNAFFNNKLSSVFAANGLEIKR